MKENFLKNFTNREREVILLVAEGMTNREIADKLIICEGTVKSYIHNILEKACLNDRRQIIIRVRDESKILSDGTKNELK